MMRRVALLRGINVGTSTRIAMADLRALLEELGGTEVATYVNSGNVVFTGGPATRALAGELVRRIHSDFGVTTSVVLMDAAKLDRIIDDMPFTGEDHAKLGVVFMDSVPKDVPDHPDIAPERVAIGRDAVYLELPNGFGRAKLSTAWFTRYLPPDCTTRNWRTVLKLRELVDR
jgi:uncharacterized protein (DUF1697 family)